MRCREQIASLPGGTLVARSPHGNSFLWQVRAAIVVAGPTVGRCTSLELHAVEPGEKTGLRLSPTPST